jgi:signal transduction histidine kinase
MTDMRGESLLVNPRPGAAQPRYGGLPTGSEGGPRDPRSVQVQEVDRTLSSLERISRALTVTTEGVNVLLQTVVDTVADVFDCPFVFLVVRNGDRELCAMHPRRDLSAPGGRPFAGAWCITEQTLLETGPMQVVCQASEGCPCEFPRNLITVPMSRDGVLQGAIALHTSGDADLDDYNSSVLQVLANQATVAIQNARLFEESQQLRRHAEELYLDAEEQRQEAERKRRELEMAQDEIAAMEREQIVSDERERIARELHDDVAQILASIGLNVEWCRQQLPADSVLQERLACLKQLARDGLYEIRHTLLGLSPTTVTELGLTGALEKLVDDFQRISRISAAIQVCGQPRSSENGNANALYHICQEALYNVFKHARAEQVQVRLVFEPDAVLVTVVDDGVGFGSAGPGEDGPTVTFGLRNMKARAEELGGRVTIERAGDRGTRVTARIPG